MFYGLTQAMMLRSVILIDSWNWLGVFCTFFQYLMLYTFTLFMAQAGPYGNEPPWFISWEFYGVAYRCYASATFWLLSLILVPVACAFLQLAIQLAHLEWFPDVNDIGRELDKGYKNGERPETGDAFGRFSLGGLFDCRKAAEQVSHRDLQETMASQDLTSLGVQAQASSRFNYSQSAEKSFDAQTPNTRAGSTRKIFAGGE